MYKHLKNQSKQVLSQYQHISLPFLFSWTAFRGKIE